MLLMFNDCDPILTINNQITVFPLRWRRFWCGGRGVSDDEDALSGLCVCGNQQKIKPQYKNVLQFYFDGCALN